MFLIKDFHKNVINKKETIKISIGCEIMRREGAIISEAQYICDVCGKKKPVSQMAGKCVKCGKYVCSACAELKGDKIYCPDHKPGWCFVATAAYGSPLASQLDTLRGFRDLKLIPNVFGRGLVGCYYRLSPPLAKVIVRSNRLRALVRFYLNPIVNALKAKGY